MATQTSSATQDGLNANIKSAWQQTSDVAQRYKAAENATRPFAKIMVDMSEQLTTLKTTPVPIFDLACGTGAVEAEIYAAVPKDQWPNLQVLAGDISKPMLDYLTQRKEEEGWMGLQTQIVDGAKLDDSDVGAEFAHIFVGFAIFVLPPDTLLKLAQKVSTGGTLAITSWAHLPWFELLEKTYVRIENGPELPTRDQLYAGMMNGRPWHQKDFIREQLESVGLKKVEIVQKKVNVDCGTPDNFMTTMGFVLGLLSSQWPEERRGGWLKEVTETMKSIVVDQVGGTHKHLFLEFEGIVGVGLKGE